MSKTDMDRLVEMYQFNMISRKSLLKQMGLEEPEWRQETQAERDIKLVVEALMPEPEEQP